MAVDRKSQFTQNNCLDLIQISCWNNDIRNISAGSQLLTA